MGIYAIDGELIICPFVASKVDKYNIPINLKNFYLELFDAFANNKAISFKDSIGLPEDRKRGVYFDYAVKQGEQINNAGSLNRTGNIYEKKFTWYKNRDFVEFEMLWEAWVPSSSNYGWVEIKIDLVNRTLKDKEVLVGNDKVVLQTGTWEFRNSFTYKNRIISDYVKKIPILGKNPSFQKLYIENFYNSALENDIIEFAVKKIKGIVYSVIEKHFNQ